MGVRVYIISILFIILISCKKEEASPNGAANLSERAVMILNEGNFRSANASLSVYYPQANEVHQDQYSRANQGVPLGDVAQSLSLINGNYWLLVNNSSRIEVLEPNNLQAIGRVSGLNSPRYCIAGPNQKVYVSDLYEKVIYVVDANNYGLSKRIATQGWTEEMVLLDDRLFVCQADSNWVLVINTTNDSLEHRIPTAKQPLSMVLDNHNMLWVACSGGINDSEPALMKIDPASLSIELDLRVPDASLSIGDLDTSPDGSHLFFSMGDIYKMNVSDTSLPTVPWHQNPTANYYAMGVDPISGEVYLSDAIDYTQDGIVYRLDPDAKLISQFKVGLIPGFFYFEVP